MIDGIEPLYQEIAQSIEDNVPEPWLKARIHVAFFTDHIAYFSVYMPISGSTTKTFVPDARGRSAFEIIREKFEEAGKPLWGRTRFEIRSDGKFAMKWDYDDCDENGFARFDEEAEWQRLRELTERGYQWDE